MTSLTSRRCKICNKLWKLLVEWKKNQTFETNVTPKNYPKLFYVTSSEAIAHSSKTTRHNGMLWPVKLFLTTIPVPILEMTYIGEAIMKDSILDYKTTNIMRFFIEKIFENVTNNTIVYRIHTFFKIFQSNHSMMCKNHSTMNKYVRIFMNELQLTVINLHNISVLPKHFHRRVHTDVIH